jgi:glycerol uptake facilitator-like aquaporin
VPAYALAQILGAFAGVAVAHLMFGEPIFFASRHARAGGAQLLGEFVATFGLLAVIQGCGRHRASAGIRPADAPGFILAQLVGGAAATAYFRWLLPPPRGASRR